MSSKESDSDKEDISVAKKVKLPKEDNDDKKKRKKKSTKKNSSDDSDFDLPAEEKNPKKTAASTKKQKVGTDEQSDGKFPLGNKRFLSVNEWKGRKQVDIREFYLADDGEMKPGKKGISLNDDQFKKLVAFIPAIQAKLSE